MDEYPDQNVVKPYIKIEWTGEGRRTEGWLEIHTLGDTHHCVQICADFIPGKDADDPKEQSEAEYKTWRRVMGILYLGQINAWQSYGQTWEKK